MTENENAEMIEQARQYFLNGFTAAEIKILLPISSAALQEIITEQRRVGAERQRQVTGQKAIILSNPPESHETAQQYARRIGVSIYSVYRYTRIGKQHPHPQSRTQAIISDLQQGTMTLSAIARKHGVSRQAVFKCKKFLRQKTQKTQKIKKRGGVEKTLIAPNPKRLCPENCTSQSKRIHKRITRYKA